MISVLALLVSVGSAFTMRRYGGVVPSQRTTRKAVEVPFVGERPATSTSTESMFELASAMLDLEYTTEMIGKVRFTKLRDGENDDDVLLYVPGIEFRGVSMGAQLESLQRSRFDTVVVWMEGEDRGTSFEELSSAVRDYIIQHNVSVVVGESFGGLVVTDVALDFEKDGVCQDLSVVLLNPATSFQKSFWAQSQAGQVVAGARSPQAYAAFIAAAVGVLASDGSMVSKSAQEMIQNRDITSSLGRAWSSAQALSKRVPAATLRYRLDEWLEKGSRRVDQKLFLLASRSKKQQSHNTLRYLVLAGEEDRFLPSATEARRLARVLPQNRSTVRILKNGGHALLVDPQRLDLGKALRAEFYSQKNRKAKDAVTDFIPPTPAELKSARDSFVDPLRTLVSPVFFSASKRTLRGTPLAERGLGQVPLPRDHQRPVLLVGNHQLFGLDLGLLVDEFLRERDELIRGLAHPAATGTIRFQNAASNAVLRTSPNWWLAGATNNISAPLTPLSNEGGTFFTKFGAVEVTPRNFFKLMQNNATALLFPGGVRESNHGKNEAHKLFWPESATEFVRLAAKFNAIIVPFGAVGIADSFDIIRDKDEPLFNRTNSNRNIAIPSARRWAGDDSEDFRFPTALPSLTRGPARTYFLFMPPFDTASLDHKDRAACASAYDSVREDVEAAIDSLLRARKNDPFERPATRLPFETLANAGPSSRRRRRRGQDESSPDTRRVQAPTFPIDILRRP